MAELGRDYIAGLREALIGFCDGVAALSQGQGVEPAPGSQAAAEQAAFPRPKSLVTTQALAGQLIVCGGDHLEAFVKTITEPMQPFACWTCVRPVLESSALAAWLLDPSVDARTRVGRGFALRHEGLEEQLKFARAAGYGEGELQKLRDRIDEVERVALGLGYPPVQSKPGKRTGIAQHMPSATRVIELMFNEEDKYRLLSAVAHGHSWAMTGLGFQRVGERGGLSIGGEQVWGFEKAVNVQGIAVLAGVAARVWARPLWYQWRYFGWDVAGLTGLLDGVFDKLGASPAVRFWRAAG